MVSDDNTKVSGRQNNFDLLRIISAIAVITIHSNFHFFEGRYSTPNLSIYYCIENLLNIITRFSVPVFIMMSGGFNLGNKRNGDCKYFYKKTIWKIGFPAVIPAFCFLLYDEISAVVTGGSIIQPIIGMIRGFYALWFLQMLFGLYMLTPIVIKLKQCVSKTEYVAIGIILLIWGGVSQTVSDYKLPYTIGIIGAFLGYYVIGDILLNIVEFKINPILYLSCAAILVGVTWIIRYMGFDFYTYVTYRNFFSPTICLMSVCVFLTFKKIKVKRDYSFLSGLTFFIYIFHTWVLNVIFKLFDVIIPQIDELVTIFIAVIITFVISGVMSYLYKELCDRLRCHITSNLDKGDKR